MKNLKLLQKEIDVKPEGRRLNHYLMYNGYRKHFGEKPLFCKAYATAELFSTIKTNIYDNDLIAGSIRGSVGALDEELFNKAEYTYFSYGFNTFITNADHFAPDYRTFLKNGLGGTFERVEKSLAAHSEPEKRDFLESVKIVLNGFKKYILNYAAAAREKANAETDFAKRENFKKMAEDLEFISENPPATYRQALQLIWLVHTAFVLEGRNAMALGRLDSYLIDYYRRDVSSGILTEDEAVALMECTLCKIKEQRFFGGDDTVNICIGGVTASGEEGINEMSYVILRAVKECNIPGPNLSARLHSGMPDEFLDECLKVIGTGLGYPALMNDDVNIPALARHGYDMADCRDYCFVGCIENFITGKQPPWSDGRFNVPMYLELVLTNGRGILKKDNIGVETGDIRTCKDMKEFLRRFEEQLRFAAGEYVASFNNENDRYNKVNYSQPFISVFCDDCIGRGMDINNGGAKYASVHGAGCMGIATVADCLAAVEKVVFIDKYTDLAGLKKAIEDNYQGHEELRDRLLAAPKYGNDDDFVDKYAVWYVEFMNEIFSKYRTRDGGAIYTAIASNIQNISAGYEIAATPDGRLSGEPVSDAASPMHGLDVSGVTAVVNSTTKPDYRLVSCGTVLNQKFSPAMFADDKQREKLASLIRVYFKKGGQEMQINSVSREVLADAMKNPDKYRDLVVRVSGFSAYYICLDKSVQEDILKRTEQG